MIKEIFRAWDNFNSCYYYSKSYESLSSFFKELEELKKGGNYLTLERYIGLIHENREVFEGDVFQHPRGEKFIVKWDQGHCSFRANCYNDNLTSLLISQLDPNKGNAKYIGTIHG